MDWTYSFLLVNTRTIFCVLVFPANLYADDAVIYSHANDKQQAASSLLNATLLEHHLFWV